MAKLYLPTLLLVAALTIGCSTNTSSILVAASTTKIATADSNIEIENLCDDLAYVRIDFIGNAGSKSFRILPGEVYSVFFGANGGYVCSTFDGNNPIRLCPKYSPPTRAGAYIELCGGG